MSNTAYGTFTVQVHPGATELSGAVGRFDLSKIPRLAGPSAELKTMLSVTGLSAVVETFADVETATATATA